MEWDVLIGALAGALALLIVKAFGEGFFGRLIMAPKEQETTVIEALVALVQASSEAQIARDKAAWDTILQMAQGLTSLGSETSNLSKDFQAYFLTLRDMISSAADRDQQLMSRLEDVHDLLKSLVTILRDDPVEEWEDADDV